MKRRRAVIVFISGVITLLLLGSATSSVIENEGKQAKEYAVHHTANEVEVATELADGVGVESNNNSTTEKATDVLATLAVKGRAPKTGYARDQFGDGWATVKGCTTRNIILYRDLENAVLDEECRVVSGVLHDTYSGETIQFSKDESTAVQIDHVVALSAAWQTGAQNLTVEQRKQLANDPLELIAVSGQQNQQKGDGDAASWLPKNKSFRCGYIARQIAVKAKYTLWVTEAEKSTMETVLKTCPDQRVPTP